MKRRTFLQTAGLAALAAGGLPMRTSSAQAASGQEVPWSGGTELPKLKAPPGATDCHHHLYNQDWPVEPTSKLRPGPASVADYRKLQQRLGLERNVIVQPSTYGTDNHGLLESLAAFGPNARGVVVVAGEISTDELKKMHDAGVRGARFNLVDPGGPGAHVLEDLAKRIQQLGWHVQLNATPEIIVSSRELMMNLPVPIVFDHLARLGGVGETSPAFAVVAELLDKRRAWMKLSGAYSDSKVGPPTYSDAGAVAKAYIKIAPDHMIWGTDWPHPGVKTDPKPDDALMLDLLLDWAPDEAMRKRILVDNPAKLYGFA